jgi:predicted nucleotidyltransferase
MKSKGEIFHLLEKNRARIKSFGVKEIGIFGSVIRGEETVSSDIDVLVEFEKKTFDSYMKLLFFLEELLGCKVDLVMKSAVKPIIKENILSETIYVQNL